MSNRQTIRSSVKGVALSHRRVDQLKALGSALSLSLTETIGHLINKEIALGTISETIPGVFVERNGEHVTVAIDDGKKSEMSLRDALGLAEAIRLAVAGDAITTPDSLGMGEKMALYAVLRRGSAIKIVVPFPGLDNSFPADVALDVARLIEKAAS